MSLFTYNFKKIDDDQYEIQLKEEDEKLKKENEMEIEAAARIQKAEKRGPGRPKKRIMPDIHDSSSSSSSSSAALPDVDTPSEKRKRIDWFATPFIYEIIEEVRLMKSSRIAVENLKKKYPQMPYEPAGKFDHLTESTVRGWFDKDWNLKPQFAESILGEERKNGGGRPRFFSAEIEERLGALLAKLRGKGKTITSGVIALLLKLVLKKEGLKDKEVSASFCRKFVKERMGWTWRSTTSGTKIPDNWKEQGILMLKRMSCWIDDINRTPALRNTFHRSLLINFDQTGVHLVPKSSHTYAAQTKRHESVDSIGEDDKRQITAMVASSADGDLLPLQLIFQGKTQRCEAKATAHVIAAQFHLTHSPNHWSNLETMKLYMQKIIEPYVQQKIIQHSLPRDSKAIVVLDCWSVHVSDEFLAYVKSQHKNIVLVFIPPNCTGKLQVADTHLNFPFKCGIRFRFNNFVVEEMLKQIDNDDIAIDLRMTTLKPLVLQWCYESWSTMKAKKEFLVHAWESLFAMFDPFSKENQDVAVRESAKDQWKLAVKYDKEDDGEEDEDSVASESDDDEKDELDIMQEIRIGSRRSARVQQQRSSNSQRRITGFFIRSDQIEDDDEE